MSDELDESGVDSGQAVTSTKPLRPTGKARRTAVATKASELTESDSGETGEVKKKPAKKAAKKSGPSSNPIARIWAFLKQVVAELRKVIWPNRKQMVSYTSVVLVFLVFMVAYISLIDLGLTRLVLLVFG